MNWVTIGGWILAGWLLLTGVLFFGQRSLLFHPDRTPPDAGELRSEGFRPLPVATEDGLSLTAWHRPAVAGRPTVVLFQGNGGHLGHRILLGEPLARMGFGLVLAPYRGFGGASGQPSEDGFYRDGRATLAALGLAPERVALWGESLGGGVATKLAAEAAAAGHPVSGVILQASFTSVPDMAAMLYPYLPARWLVRDPFDNLSRIGSIGAPVLIAHGERDPVVPIAHGRKLFDAAKGPKQAFFVPGASHNDLHAHGLIDRIAAFLDPAR